MISQTGVDIFPGTKENTASTESIFEFLSSDVDLGGFEPPLEHVSLSDIHKKTNIKLSVQQGSDTNKNPTCLNDMNDDNRTIIVVPSDTVDFVLNEAFSVGVGNNDSSTTAADVSSKTQASQVVNADGEVARGTELEHDSSNAFPDESDEERKKLAYEERQKRTWEGIDPWIYKEFHDYVELI